MKMLKRDMIELDGKARVMRGKRKGKKGTCDPPATDRRQEMPVYYTFW
jgi:hypothetical protein